MKITKYIIYICTSLLLICCNDGAKTARIVEQLPPIYPDYIGVTVPASIAPLNFNIPSDSIKKIKVNVKGNQSGEMSVEGKYAHFPIKEWHDMLNKNVGSELYITVYAQTSKEWIRYQDFTINVSQYPLDEWGLTYRRIAPGYEVYSAMGIYQRDLSNFNESPIIENTQTSGLCYNCHTSNCSNSNQTVFHVRGDHGATMIQQNGECRWLQAINDSIKGAMVYPYWHPSGRYCAFSTNQTRQGFHVSHDKRIEVFDLSSDVLVFDVEKNQILLDTLLCKTEWSENIPVFSPDGKSLYFTTAYQQDYPTGYKEQRYNLCRIDFDPEKGSFGEKVDTIFDAQALGKSVTWPRPSYDNRYILFTLIDYGYFSIWHKEADQWLLDLATGKAQPLDAINSNDADSFHNWSSNSRWIVFTSRQDDGLYSRLYLASIDENGKATKPFMLPQENPHQYYDNSLYSFNTPDFIDKKIDFDSHAAVEEIISDERIKPTVR